MEEKLRKYFINNIDKILKEPIGFIRYPFIDPGSVYHGNVWDWDTYWSVYGLLNLMDNSDVIEPTMKAKIIKHAKGNVYNFLDHQLEDGYIPMMIEIGQWHEPYLNIKHKEGVIMNMHKPFLCQQICLISDYIKDYNWISNQISKLEKYFECYYKNYYQQSSGLFVWCDDIMIGVDNDPSSFGRPKFSTANIYLNSFMVMELKAMASIFQHTAGSDERVFDYLERSNKLVHAIQSECWDRRDRFYYSVDVDIKTRQFDWFHVGLGVFWKTLPIKIRVWSGFIPMLSGFATEEQAKELVNHIFDNETFASDYGITTLAKDEKMFDLSATNNPSNWLGPIWLVANYIVFRGLMNYGYYNEAKLICKRTVELLGRDLEKSGCLHEYYNPFTGEPVMNGGFINWNMLVINMIDEIG